MREHPTKRLLRHQHDKKRERPEGKLRREEGNDDGGEHQNYLFPVLDEITSISLRGYQARIDHEMFGDDGIQHDEDE